MSRGRSFPLPWSVEEEDGRFVVRAHNGRAFRYIYFKDQRDRGATTALFTRDGARHIADSVAQLPELWHNNMISRDR
jgi:hypothetical protein